MSATDRQVVTENLGFPEAPRWHGGRLWLSDIATGEVVSVGPDGRAALACAVAGRPSGLGWLPDGSLLVVSMQQRRVLRLAGGALATHVDASDLVTEDLNDMVVDDSGFAYVSNFGCDAKAEPQTPTGVLVVAPDGSATMQPGAVYRPNGMAITPDGASLIVAETRIHRLSAFDIGPGGTLGNQRTFAEMPADSWPDGICLDAQGGVWVGDCRGCRCLRVEEGGEVTDVVDTSPLPSLACILGGEDRRTLYMMVAPLIAMERAAVERGARVESVRVTVPGAGWP